MFTNEKLNIKQINVVTTNMSQNFWNLILKKMRVELKKSAIFGSQWTATLDQSLVLVKWRHGLTTQLVSIVSFSTRIFFALKFQNFDLCLWSHYLLIIFLFTKIYFVNHESYFVLHSMYFTIIFLIYVLCFQHVFSTGMILSATECHT